MRKLVMAAITSVTLLTVPQAEAQLPTLERWLQWDAATRIAYFEDAITVGKNLHQIICPASVTAPRAVTQLTDAVKKLSPEERRNVTIATATKITLQKLGCTILQ